MIMHVLRFFTILIFVCCHISQAYASAKRIIAERGAAGSSLIEHSLPAATLAAAMGVEYLELHVVMTSDDQLVVFHDLTLDRLTDVAQVFPDRKRQDGAYYVIDFSLEELRRLRILGSADGKNNDFPLTLSIPTLAEELRLLRRLESILDRQLGIFLEIRQPWFHLEADKDISAATLDTLARFRYTTPESKLYLQCYDPDELQRIFSQLMPDRQMQIPLIQMLGANDGLETKQIIADNRVAYNYDWLFTNTGLRLVASYAVALAIPAQSIAGSEGNLPLAGYIGEAHRHGLMVFALAVNDTPDLPVFAADYHALVDFYFVKAELDGIYTDHFQEIQAALRQVTEETVVAQESLPIEEASPVQSDSQPENDLPPFFKNLNLVRPTPQPTKPEEEMKNAASEERHLQL